MITSDVELEFQPEFNALCYLIDSPIIMGLFLISFLCLVVFHVYENMMMFVAFAVLGLILKRFMTGSRDITATLGVVYPDRVEVEVGMKNPKMVMIEYANLKKVEAVQSPIQKIFGTYSIKFTYISDFTGKDIYYSVRDFKSPKHIIDRIKKAQDNSHLRRENDRTQSAG